MATTNSELAKEWHPTKNGKLLPTMYSAGSNKKVWWKCSRGHEWESKISNRVILNRNCPYCSNQKVLNGFNDFASNYPELVVEWDYKKNENLKPSNFTKSSGKKVWWIGKCGHEWQATIAHRINGTGCLICMRDVVAEKRSKNVVQYSLDGELIEIYDSLKKAAEKLGITQSNISHACSSKQYSAGGYKWKYLEDEK